MGYHIVHLVSTELRAAIDHNRLAVTNTTTGEESFVPLEDIAVIIAASTPATITTAALKRLAENNVILLVCNDRYEPVSFLTPYYRCVSTDTLRAQLALTEEVKTSIWTELVRRKILNQGEALGDLPGIRDEFAGIAAQCGRGNPDALEVQAARRYWKHFLPLVSDTEETREKRTREGANGLLDYGYAIIRSAVLRSLAVHGFIAAIGIHHKERAGTFALADDLVEPLRPFVDRQLRKTVADNDGQLPEIGIWRTALVDLLGSEFIYRDKRIRLLPIIDDYIESFGRTIVSGTLSQFQLPVLQ